MTYALSGLHIGLIIGGIALVLIVVSLIVIFALKSNNKNKYFIKIDNLLSNLEIENKSQLDAYLVRLKNIANNNSDFVDIYQQINAQYESLMNTEKDKIITRHRGLKERIGNENKIKKGLIEQIKSFENAVLQYLKEVKRIQKDLENYFKAGDELRIKLTDLQEKYRQIQSEVNKYSSSISICKTELLDYLADIGILFDLFDNNLAGARYVEAEKNLARIDKSVFNLYGHIEQIAQYCKTVEVIIPNQIDDLIKKNNALQEQGYVVAHSKVFEFAENTYKLLEGCKLDFKKLCFTNFDAISYEIQEKFSEIHAHLDQEKMSKDELEGKYKCVSEKVAKAETAFIKTKRHFATMLDYYKIPSSFSLRFKNFENNATKLTGLKIEYESLQYLQNSHPASFLLSKVDNLEKLCDEVNDDIAFFTSYFKNIKDFVEDTYVQTNEISIKLSKVLAKVRKNRCKKVYEKYVNEVNSTLSSLKAVHQILLKKPIDIETLDNKFANLVSKADDLASDINIELENYQLVLKCIIYANPLRSQFVEVNKTLDEVDELFNSGNYLAAQEKINVILNEYHPAAFDSFKG